jgi:hypothetical protein
MDDGSGPIQVVQILLPIAWEPLWCNTNDRVPFASYTDGWGTHAFSDGNRTDKSFNQGRKSDSRGAAGSSCSLSSSSSSSSSM